MMSKTFTMTIQGRALAVETLVDIALITAQAETLAKQLLMFGAPGFTHHSDTELAEALLRHGCELPEGTVTCEAPAADYSVCWRIDIEGAASATDAAHRARACQRPGTWATVFEVIGPNGQRTEVDIEQDILGFVEPSNQVQPVGTPA